MQTAMSELLMHHPNFIEDQMNLSRNNPGRDWLYGKTSPPTVCKTDCELTRLNLKDQLFNPLIEIKSAQEPIDEWKSKSVQGKQLYVDLHL